LTDSSVVIHALGVKGGNTKDKGREMARKGAKDAKVWSTKDAKGLGHETHERVRKGWNAKDAKKGSTGIRWICASLIVT